MTGSPTHEVRLTSRRAPYRRAGVAFASTRTPVIIAADALTDAQLETLQADPVISIEVIDTATGDVVALQTDSGAAIGIGIGAASADVAPEAAGSGEGNGGQTGAGSVSPAPTTAPDLGGGGSNPSVDPVVASGAEPSTPASTPFEAPVKPASRRVKKTA